MPAARSPEPHAGLMDRVYRRQRHIYDFTRKYYLLGRDRLIQELDPAPGDKLVEIGCGTARNLIRIARQWPDLTLYGLDASEEMLKTARARVAGAGLSHRITLAHGLAEDLTPHLFGGVDHAVFSYSLSMIPDWRRALAAAGATLNPGGRLHIVDFGDLKGLPPGAEAVLRAWLGLFHVTPRGELLAGLEGGDAPARGRLILLPGRYAFRLSAYKSETNQGSLCGLPVTARG